MSWEFAATHLCNKLLQHTAATHHILGKSWVVLCCNKLLLQHTIATHTYIYISLCQPVHNIAPASTLWAHPSRSTKATSCTPCSILPRYVVFRTWLCCSVLQRGAGCCRVLQCGALWCSVVQCGAVCCIVMLCVAVFFKGCWHTPWLCVCSRYIQPQHNATHCNILQHTAMQLPSTIKHCKIRQDAATHCNTLQHTATHCNTL